MVSIPCCALSRPPRAVVVAFVTAGSLLFVSVYRVLFLLVSIFGYSVYFIDSNEVDKKRGGEGGEKNTHEAPAEASSFTFETVCDTLRIMNRRSRLH